MFLLSVVSSKVSIGTGADKGLRVQFVCALKAIPFVLRSLGGAAVTL